MTAGQLQESHCLDSLIANQNSDGGWGYQLVSPSAAEATSWVLAALGSCRQTPPLLEACARASKWLLQAQGADGSWPPFPGQPQGSWVTSVAAHALHLHGGAQEAVERGMRWVLAAWPAERTLRWRVRQSLFPSRVAHQDNTLCGWSWTPGTASWVEPTSHALIFLRSLPPDLLPPHAAKRRQMAERMLYDRMCPGGGWNSGNPQVYGVPGVASIGPTSWALLALAHSAHVPAMGSSVNWLERAYPTARGPASLVMAHRCLQACGRNPGSLVSDIVDLYSHNRFFESTLTVAWLGLALAEEPQRPDERPSEGAPA